VNLGLRDLRPKDHRSSKPESLESAINKTVPASETNDGHWGRHRLTPERQMSRAPCARFGALASERSCFRARDVVGVDGDEAVDGKSTVHSLLVESGTGGLTNEGSFSKPCVVKPACGFPSTGLSLRFRPRVMKLSGWKDTKLFETKLRLRARSHISRLDFAGVLRNLKKHGLFRLTCLAPATCRTYGIRSASSRLPIPSWSRRRPTACCSSSCSSPTIAVPSGTSRSSTAAWTVQQLREASQWDEAPRYLLHRDHAFDRLGARQSSVRIESPGGSERCSMA
jgi:hypothetical protein